MNIILAIGLIIGGAMLVTATYVYAKRPEHGQGGWALTLIGFLLVTVSLFDSFELSNSGLKAQLKSNTQNTVNINETVNKNSNTISALKKSLDQLYVKYSSLKTTTLNSTPNTEDQKNLLSIKSGNFDFKNKSVIKTLANVADSGYVLLEQMDKINNEVNVDIDLLNSIVLQVRSNEKIKQHFVARIPDLLKTYSKHGKRKYLESVELLYADLQQKFLELKLSSNKESIFALLSSLETLKDENVFTDKSNSLRCNVKTYAFSKYGTVSNNFWETKLGDYLMIANNHDLAPLRQDIPGFFGTMAKSLGNLPKASIVKFNKLKQTKVRSAPWYQVAVDCSSNEELISKSGWVAWFGDRFVAI